MGLTKSGHEREVPLTLHLRSAMLAAGVDRRPEDECAALNPKGEVWRHRGRTTCSSARCGA